MAYSSFDHSILKAALASVVKLTYSHGSRYPSLLLIMEGLRRLEKAFAREHQIADKLQEWESRGYQLKGFRTKFDREKVERLETEFAQLQRDIQRADRVRSRLVSLPYSERTKLEAPLLHDPAKAVEVERRLLSI